MGRDANKWENFLDDRKINLLLDEVSFSTGASKTSKCYFSNGNDFIEIKYTSGEKIEFLISSDIEDSTVLDILRFYDREDPPPPNMDPTSGPNHK